MKNLFVVFAFVLMGCAALNGQVAYNGPVSGLPTMGFETHRTIDPCGPRMQSACMVAHTTGWVTNASSQAIKVTINCNDLYTFYPNLVIPPRTTQYFLVDKSASSCWLADREVVPGP